MAAAIFDPEVGLFDPARGISSYRFVHKTQRFHWQRPVRSGDVIETTVRLTAAEELADGRALRVFESSSLDASGEALVEARYEGVVPPPMGASSRPPSAPQPPLAPGAQPARLTELEAGDALPDLRLVPDRYAPVRYAGASGDFTPFHLDAEAARALGLQGPILHGLYSFAQVARAHMAPFGSDPRVLRSLSGRFRRPAYPERELVVRTLVDAVDPDAGIRTLGEARQGDASVIGEIEGLLRPGAPAG